MCSAQQDVSDDVTARARIRDTAIRLFGTQGYAKTSVRAIAQEAGTSPGLILHHFGSKDGLRAACDEVVTGSIFADQQNLDSPTAEVIQRLLADANQYQARMSYLSRMLTESSAEGKRLFDQMLAGTKNYLQEQTRTGAMREVSDPDVTALLLTIFGLAPLVLLDHFERGLGYEPFSPEGLARQTLPMLEMFTEGLYTDDSILQAVRNALTDTNPSKDEKEALP